MINDDFTKTGSGQTQGKHSKTDRTVAAGKTKSIGVSNFGIEQLEGLKAA